MKKIFFFATLAVLALASCGNKTAQDAEGLDTAAVALEVPAEAETAITELTEQLTAGDADKMTVALASVQTTYAELVNSGKLDEAKKYASAVQEFVKENAEKIKKFANANDAITKLVDGVVALPTSVETTAEEAAAAVDADAKSIVEKIQRDAEETAEEAVEGVKEEVNAKVDAAKEKVNQKVNEKVEEAKTKANEAASKAINDAASKILGK